MTIIDKLENLEEVFEVIKEHFGLENVRLCLDDISTDTLGDIYMQSFWDGQTDLNHVITIRNGAINYGSYYETVHDRLFKFLENIEVEVTPLSRTVILILHEYGHVNRAQIMYGFNQEEMADLIDRVTDGLLANPNFVRMTSQVCQTNGIDLMYMLNSNEMYADAFAMKHFMRAWRKIQRLTNSRLQ